LSARQNGRVSATEPDPAAPQVNPLFRELLWVHSMIRRDLEAVSELATACAEGADAAEIRDGIVALKTNGPLWRLKVNCLHYCRFVESHHHTEDVAVFPTLRRREPDLGPTIDRLESDHRDVAALLERVEAAADALVDGERNAARSELVAALEALGGTLLSHLAFEEESLEAPLGRIRTWMG
jgi:hypothetical protein